MVFYCHKSMQHSKFMYELNSKWPHEIRESVFERSPWLYLIHRLPQTKGSFNNYMAKFYPILTPSPLKWTIVDILHYTYPLSRDQARTFYWSPPPLLVHIVIEWPLTKVWVKKLPNDQINSLNFWLFKLFLVFLAVQTFLSISSDTNISYVLWF